MRIGAWGGGWGVRVGKGVAIKKKEGVRFLLGSFATQKECVLVSRDEGSLELLLEVVGRARSKQKEGVVVLFACVCVNIEKCTLVAWGKRGKNMVGLLALLGVMGGGVKGGVLCIVCFWSGEHGWICCVLLGLVWKWGCVKMKNKVFLGGLEVNI